MEYRVTFVESQEGCAVWCDDLPGCVSQGSTPEEAEVNIRIAIREYLESIDELPAIFGTTGHRKAISV